MLSLLPHRGSQRIFKLTRERGGTNSFRRASPQLGPQTQPTWIKTRKGTCRASLLASLSQIIPSYFSYSKGRFARTPRREGPLLKTSQLYIYTSYSLWPPVNTAHFAHSLNETHSGYVHAKRAGKKMSFGHFWGNLDHSCRDWIGPENKDNVHQIVFKKIWKKSH